MLCPGCGKSIDDETKPFCTSCGASLQFQQPPATPQPAPAPQAPKVTGGNRRLWLILGIVVAVVVVAGIATTLILVFAGNGQSPQSALETFGKEISAPGADYYSTAITGMVTKDALDKNEGSQTGDYFYTNAKEYLSDGIKIESVIDTGGIATVKYHSNALNKTCTAILVKEDGFWRIQEVRTIKEEMDTIFQK